MELMRPQRIHAKVNEEEKWEEQSGHYENGTGSSHGTSQTLNINVHKQLSWMKEWMKEWMNFRMNEQSSAD